MKLAARRPGRYPHDVVDHVDDVGRQRDGTPVGADRDVTALGDTDGCAQGLVRRFIRTQQVGSCTGRTTVVDAMGTFPSQATELGRRGTIAATAEDVIDRWWNNYSGHGVGLYGGTWRYTGSDVVRFRLHDVRLVGDLAVSGRVVWDRYAGTVTTHLTGRMVG